MLERLRTSDKLVAMGIHNDDSCVLCSEEESHKHLFFECEYSLKCLRMLRVGWGYVSPRSSLTEWCIFCQRTRGLSFREES